MHIGKLGEFLRIKFRFRYCFLFRCVVYYLHSESTRVLSLCYLDKTLAGVIV